MNDPFEILDDDPEIVRNIKHRARLLNSMSKPEREVFWQSERLYDAERLLQSMIDENKDTDDFTEYAREQAMKYEDESRDAWLDVAIASKGSRYTIADIRQQRRKVQWERTKLTKMEEQVQQRTEPKNS